MIRIMVDSASDICREDALIDYFVPITVSIGGRDYRTGIDLDNDTFYSLLTAGKEFPKTSQPSPQEFAACIEQAMAGGDDVIYFGISSEVSGTFQSCLIAKQMTGYDRIYPIDTRGATHMIATLVKYARKLICEGFSADEIVEKCEAFKGRIRVFAGVDTLEYLFRGGRLSRSAFAIGELAGIKPVVALKDGRVEPLGKALGRSRAIQLLLKQLELYKPDKNYPICTLYTYGDENPANLEKHLNARGYGFAERLQIGPSIGAHLGPGLYGITYVSES